jgi:rubrerythrin
MQCDLLSMQNFRSLFENLEEHDMRKQIYGFFKDHMRHIHELSSLVSTLGGKTPHSEAKECSVGVVSLPLKNKHDQVETLLQEILRSESEVLGLYERLLQEKHLSPMIKRRVYYAWEDEKRHLLFVKEILAADSSAQRKPKENAFEEEELMKKFMQQSG